MARESGGKTPGAAKQAKKSKQAEKKQSNKKSSDQQVGKELKKDSVNSKKIELQPTLQRSSTAQEKQLTEKNIQQSSVQPSQLDKKSDLLSDNEDKPVSSAARRKSINMNSNEESVFADNQGSAHSDRDTSSQPARVSNADDRIRTGGDRDTRLNTSPAIQPDKSHDSAGAEDQDEPAAKLDD